MDNGPFRMGNSASTNRPANNRAQQPAEEEQEPVHKEPVRRSSTTHRREPVPEPKGKKKLIAIIASIVAAVVLIGGMIAIWMGNQANTAVAIDTSKYQAVFFTNGQVYFGKLSVLNGSYMKLTDVFYLQSKSSDDSGNPQKTSSEDNNNVELIKLGNEIHGPTDQMVVSKDQVLFFENLKSDGKVASTIDQYNKSNKK